MHFENHLYLGDFNMRKVFLCFSLVLSASISASAAGLGSTILARYSNFYAGDDDAFATCLIMQDARGVLLIDGIVPNSLDSFTVKRDDMQALEIELKKL